MVDDIMLDSDVLVIGGGMAGIFAAAKARERGARVILVDKGYTSRSGSSIYTDSFSVFNPKWGHKLNDWMEEIARLGDYINKPEWTEISLKESYDRYLDLISWGVTFQRREDGEPVRFANGILEKCSYGQALPHLTLMRKQLIKIGVKIIDRVMITDLIQQDGEVFGAVGFHTNRGDYYIFQAKATILCTGTGSFGGFGTLEMPFAYDGEAMAYKAGAVISNKEFTWAMAPTINNVGHYMDIGGEGKMSLENRKIKLAPEGWHAMMMPGRFVDAEGNIVNLNTMLSAVTLGRAPIFYSVDDNKDTHSQLPKKSKNDIDLDSLESRKEDLYLGITRNESNIGGAALGGGTGIWSTDTNGGTTLVGLYAAGECYHSGAVGAVYPFQGFGARNAAVTGARAGRGAAEHALTAKNLSLKSTLAAELKKSVYSPVERNGGFDAEWITLQLKTIMIPYYVWLIRHEDRLKAALTMVEFLNSKVMPMIYCRPKDPHGLRIVHEATGRVLVAEMMLRSAKLRTESRGTHYREDYPRRDDANWLFWIKIANRNNYMVLDKEPIPEKFRPDPSIPYEKRYPRRYVGEK